MLANACVHSTAHWQVNITAKSWKRPSVLKKAYVLYIMEGESVSVQDDITTLVEDFERVTLQCTGMEKELDELHEQIGSLVLSEKASRPNSGKPIDELSPRQTRRKMSEFRDHVEAVLIVVCRELRIKANNTPVENDNFSPAC